MRVIVQRIEADSLEGFLVDSGAVRSNAAEQEVILNATTGEVSSHPTYRMVFLLDGVLIYLRVPGERCATLEGDSASIARILNRLRIPCDPFVLLNA